ncbi:MAG: hypothetical protein LBU89_00385 [Fibromonadaceae bacterium]|jgi:hypothetical protein|nr:hypothetical protein [Fibromonadaceae bacterium]
MLKFRNIDVSPSDPVEEWGVEGILCAFERGSIDDWRKVWKSVYVDKSKIVIENVQEATQMRNKGDLGYAVSRAFCC